MLILAQCIGLIPPEMSFSDGLSGLFHSSNPISEALFAFLQGLVRAGVLEAQKNEFRWNQAFRGEWLDDS